jgi:hypothetical protein
MANHEGLWIGLVVGGGLLYLASRTRVLVAGTGGGGARPAAYNSPTSPAGSPAQLQNAAYQSPTSPAASPNGLQNANYTSPTSPATSPNGLQNANYTSPATSPATSPVSA